MKALIESIQRALKRKVQITQRRGPRPGRIELEYYSDDDLTILSAHLSPARNAIVFYCPSPANSLIVEERTAVEAKTRRIIEKEAIA